MSDWIAAEDARSRLGVRAQTLYAYVSRGRVRVRPDPADPRRSLYRAADIAALNDRKSRSRRPADVAAGAIAWGEPVLNSAITTIAEVGSTTAAATPSGSPRPRRWNPSPACCGADMGRP